MSSRPAIHPRLARDGTGAIGAEQETAQGATNDDAASGLTSFTPDRPLLLLTDFSPETKGGGAVNIRSLLAPEDRARIVWATLSPLPGSGRGVVSLARSGKRSVVQDSTVRLHRLREAAEDVLRTHGAAAAWVVAHSACLRIAPALIQAGIPVHITVQDDPAWAWALRTRRYIALAPLFERDLRFSLRGARSVDVVSEAMARRYRERHGINTTIVNRGFAGPVQPAPPYDRRHGLSVAVLGSTYGLRELRVLAQALAIAEQKLAVPTKLTVIGGGDGAQIRKTCPSSLVLETTGYLEEPDGVDILRESFLLYLNYPFARRGRTLRTTSFATKLSTYVMAARPLVLHMPPDSSVASIGATPPFATLWSSLDPKQGSEIIARLWRDETIDQSFDAAAEQVREQYFDLSRNRAALFSALNSLAGSPG